MIPGILITNGDEDGGIHSPQKWALMTAQMLINAFNVKDDSPRKTQIEMAKEIAKGEITKIMMAHHKTVQDAERDHMQQGHSERLTDFAPDPAEHTNVEQCVAEVRTAVQPIMDQVRKAELVAGEVNMGLGVEQMHFEPHMMLIIRQRIEMDLRTVMLIERLDFATKHPGQQHAIMFKAYNEREGHPDNWHPSINPRLAGVN